MIGGVVLATLDRFSGDVIVHHTSALQLSISWWCPDNDSLFPHEPPMFPFSSSVKVLTVGITVLIAESGSDPVQV